MGSRHDADRAYQEKAKSQAALYKQGAQTAAAEKTRGQIAAGLGTEEQVFGQGSYDPRLDNYSNRLELDESSLANFNQMRYSKKSPQNSSEYNVNIKNQYNDLMGQASAAAAAGNYTQADALKAQAESVKGTIGAGTVASMFSDVLDPDSAARKKLGTAEGKLVGRALYDSAGLLAGPGNAVYDQTYGQLTDKSLEAVDLAQQMGERAVTNEKEGLARQLRDFGSSRGAGRNIYTDLAASAELSDKTAKKMADVASTSGLQRAAIHSDAAKYITDVKYKLAQDSVGFANAWIGGSSELRDQYVATQNGINQNVGALANQWANTYYSAYQSSRAREREQSGWVNFAVGLVGSIVGGAVSAYTGGAFGDSEAMEKAGATK